MTRTMAGKAAVSIPAQDVNMKNAPPFAEETRQQADGCGEMSIHEVLEVDARPSFMIDMFGSSAGRSAGPCYYNPALCSNHILIDAVKSSLIHATHTSIDFHGWVHGMPDTGAHYFQGHMWSQCTIRRRWRLLQGVAQPTLASRRPLHNRSISTPINGHQSSVASEADQSPSVVGASDAQTQLPDQSRRELESLNPNVVNGDPPPANTNNFDCTIPRSIKATEHIDYMHAVDWAKTALGPIEAWDPQLRTMINVVMDDPMPSALYIGPEYIMIYNEAFVPLMHKYHPSCFGTSAPVSQAEYWKAFEGIINHNIRTGKAVTHDHLQLFLRRNGMLEETYFSFSFLPVIGAEGKIIAHYEPINETTREVISQRRMNTLLDAGQETAVVRDQTAFWDQVLSCLHRNEKDVPFALLYSVGDDGNPTASPGIETNPFNLPVTARQCLLRASVGIPNGHHAAAETLNFQQGDQGWAPFFQIALAASRPVVFHEEDHPQLRQVLQGVESTVFGDRITSVVVSLITPTAFENILAFLVIGLNPRTPYNEDYQQFIHVASRLIETSLASVVLLEEEVRTRERMALQAAEEQQKLAAELKTSQLESERREQKFQRFAERANVGIFVLDRGGNYTYRNPAWFDIFQPAAEDIHVRDAWLKLVEPDDLERCEALFRQLYTEKTTVSFELRLRRRWAAPEEMQDSSLVSDSRTWILCSAYPELTEDGEVFEILGCVTDVSRQKYGEGLQTQRTALALESKRRLENFIDTTSHEMRNPLTAIIQCADGIIQSHVALLQTTDDAVSVTLDHLETSLDGAQTIVQCAQHQKRIVDDILTMSKLDSDLLSIAPVQTQPRELAARSVKMLESEARAADVDMRFEVEQSFENLKIDTVLLDPTRLMQVLINLITNAIKFTRLEDRREVVVSIGASLVEQPASAHGVQYIRRVKEQTPVDLAPADSEGKGSVYVHFTVRDTGRGLNTQEKDLIFSRFSQASPKTHIHYGGSGLGLFISRRLVEMLGGSIGFASERRAGSTFSFYVKTTRVPSNEIHGPPLLQTKRSRSRSSTPKFEAPQISSMPYQPPRGTESQPSQYTEPQALHEQLRDSRERLWRTQSIAQIPSSPTSPPQQEIRMDRSLHVLVVEDNLVNQRVLAKQLSGLGCIVAVANHGAEAISYLQGTTFCKTSTAGARAELDVVLMDWEMPVMNGLTCVGKIRALQRDGSVVAHVPIIGITANARLEQLDQAMAAGMVSEERLLHERD